MSVPLTINGSTYDYPIPGDIDWGPDATDWAAAVTTGMLQKAGGVFQLLAEVDFGTAYGVKSLYLKSRTASTADAGFVRLAKTDVVSWRNNAGGGNLDLGINGSDLLEFNGTVLQGAVTVSDTATIDLTFTSNTLSADIKTDSITNGMVNSAAGIVYSKLSLTGGIVDADVNAAAAIALSKLATVAASKALVSDSGGLITASSVTATELSYLAGVSSAIQTQLDAKTTISGQTAHGVVIASVTNAMTSTGAGSAGQPLVSNGASLDPTYQRLPIVGGGTNSALTLNNNRAMISNGGSIVENNAFTPGFALYSGTGSATFTESVTTSTELGYVHNVTSAIQTQLDSKTAKATLTAKGSIYGATAASTPAELAVGVNDTILMAASGQSTGLKWATPTETTATLNVMTGDAGSGGLKGLVPAQATGDALKFLNGGGTWSTPAGAGDVVGPGSATDLAVAIFDGTTGKLIKNSVIGTNANTVSTFVKRDASGNFSAGTITAALTGNASTATKSTNIAGGAGGQVLYQSAADTTTPLANGTAGQVLLSAGGTAAPVWTPTATTSNSSIVRGTAASKGGSSSGETTVVNYSAAITSTGSDITFTARDATHGDKYTINTAGIYAVWFSGTDSAAGNAWGVTVNSTGLSTAVESMTASQVPCLALTQVTSGASNASCTLSLAVNDVVRIQVSSGSVPGTNTYTRFGITRVS